MVGASVLLMTNGRGIRAMTNILIDANQEIEIRDKVMDLVCDITGKTYKDIVTDAIADMVEAINSVEEASR